MPLLLRSNKNLLEQLPHNQNIFLHPGQKPSPQLSALCKTSFVLFECRTPFGWCVSCCSGGVCVYRCSSPCLLPGAWLRNCSQESRLQVVGGGGGFCSHFSMSPLGTLEHFCYKKRRQFAFISEQLCMLKASGKFNAGCKRLRNALLWCETKE